jgi:uncharacterized spore protein YtfJ
MDHLNGILEAVTLQLDNVAKSDIVVGTPVTVGDHTVVPISRVSVGMGAGGGTGEGESPHHKKHGVGRGKGTGGGAGGGGKVRPVAVLVFGVAGLQVFSIADKPGKLDRVIDKLPGWIEHLKEGIGKSKDN